MGVTLKKNGIIVDTGAPAAALGDPFLSVLGLARSLGREGKRIEPGMVVLTGGLTAASPFGAGDRIEIVWPDEVLSFRAE
jgi:2-keto-4-pentenoate hydratase